MARSQKWPCLSSVIKGIAMNIKHLKADILLIGGMILLGAVLALVLLLGKKEGAKVQIRVSGEVIEEFSLSKDQTYEIQGKDGVNVLTIADGEAWIAEASCPDKLCVHMGKIHLNGQSIVCLPNQVVIEIVDEHAKENPEQQDDVDAVAGGRQ